MNAWLQRLSAQYIALCNGVRGLKWINDDGQDDLLNIALCNGVRGLKWDCFYPGNGSN